MVTPNVPQPKEQKSGLLDFVSPTQFVDLPSKGLGYPESHPFFSKEAVEIRFMTAKDEDILSSESLLRKGIAVDRFLKNVLMDDNIVVDSILIGDKNAILIAARISGYGNLYETQIQCPSCNAKNDLTFDLNRQEIHHGEIPEDSSMTRNESGNFILELPLSSVTLEFRLLTGKDEKEMIKKMADAKKKKSESTSVTDQYQMMTVSAQGETNRKLISKFIGLMPVGDSKLLRNAYKAVAPDVKIKDDFECTSCDYEQELEVPFGADFFWPKQ
tara:strand:- start:736 stop:1551 length:816 start_codon:yes stop_codon:yes gene_type:complete